MTPIGVIGYGYWGPNLVRNFSRNPRAEAVRVADRDPKQQARIKATYSDLDVVGEGEAVITTGSASLEVNWLSPYLAPALLDWRRRRRATHG